jgi:hypothetical protein
LPPLFPGALPYHQYCVLLLVNLSGLNWTILYAGRLSSSLSSPWVELSGCSCWLLPWPLCCSVSSTPIHDHYALPSLSGSGYCFLCRHFMDSLIQTGLIWSLLFGQLTESLLLWYACSL